MERAEHIEQNHVFAAATLVRRYNDHGFLAAHLHEHGLISDEEYLEVRAKGRTKEPSSSMLTLGAEFRGIRPRTATSQRAMEGPSAWSLVARRNDFCCPDNQDLLQRVYLMIEANIEEPDRESISVELNLSSLVEYLACEIDDVDDEDLGSVLVVMGTATKAFATTCSDYTYQCWCSGSEMLDMLSEVRKHRKVASTRTRRKQKKLSSGVVIFAWDLGFAEGRLEVNMASGAARFILSGPRAASIYYVQQFVWMCAVFRSTRSGPLAYSTVSFSQKRKYFFSVQIQKLQPVPCIAGSCWQGVFQNCVLARGFPISERDGQLGVEIPFGTILVLGRVLYEARCIGTVLLKGRSTMLVPIDSTAGGVQWHLLSAPDNQTISLDAVQHMCDSVLEIEDLAPLASQRTFLGCCRKVQIHLGTVGSGYELVTSSGAPFERPGPQLSRELSTTFGLSKFITASIGSKVLIPKGLMLAVNAEDQFIPDMIRNSKSQPLVLYDVPNEQTWMVPELSTVLHLAHAWACKQPDSSEVQRHLPFAHEYWDGGQAAYESINNSGEKVLRLARGGDKEITVYSLIRRLLLALGDRKASQRERENQLFGALHRRPRLSGWDFEDIAKGCSLPRLKTIEINQKSSGGWSAMSFVDANVAVLFGSNFGQSIQNAARRRSVESSSTLQWNMTSSWRLYNRSEALQTTSAYRNGFLPCLLVCIAVVVLSVGSPTGKFRPYVHRLSSKKACDRVPLHDRGAIHFGNPDGMAKVPKRVTEMGDRSAHTIADAVHAVAHTLPEPAVPTGLTETSGSSGPEIERVPVMALKSIRRRPSDDDLRREALEGLMEVPRGTRELSFTAKREHRLQ